MIDVNAYEETAGLTEEEITAFIGRFLGTADGRVFLELMRQKFAIGGCVTEELPEGEPLHLRAGQHSVHAYLEQCQFAATRREEKPQPTEEDEDV